MMPKMAVVFNITLLNMLLYIFVLYNFYKGKHWANLLVRTCVVVSIISILIASILEWKTLTRMSGQGLSLSLYFVAYSLVLILCSRLPVKCYFCQQRHKKTFGFLKCLTSIKTL